MGGLDLVEEHAELGSTVASVAPADDPFRGDGKRAANSDVVPCRVTYRTMACSGGECTTSRTLATKFGSIESLNVSIRCGWRPKARQMRCTANIDRSLAFAKPRELQRVVLVLGIRAE